MDEVESELLKVARELAAASESRLRHTTAEIAELEEQLRQLRAQRHGQLDAQGRLNSYQPKVGANDYRCPNCWIVDGKPALLKSIPFERPDEDIMRCPSCGRDFGISLRAEMVYWVTRTPTRAGSGNAESRRRDRHKRLRPMQRGVMTVSPPSDSSTFGDPGDASINP